MTGVMNKVIDNKQCTIVWDVDDLKISHEDPDVVGQFIDLIKEEFGCKMDLPVWQGRIHDYLGIQVNFSEDQKVKLTMYDHIDKLINKMPVELMKGSGVMPAANHMFLVNPECDKLNEINAVLYHHLTANFSICPKE
jgi:hypothetical protein